MLEITAKIAGILSLGLDKRVVNEPEMQYAINMARRNAYNVARELREVVGDTQFERDCKRVLRLIKCGGKPRGDDGEDPYCSLEKRRVTRSVLLRKSNMRASELDSVITYLIEVESICIKEIADKIIYEFIRD
jgi:hypothetical protein